MRRLKHASPAPPVPGGESPSLAGEPRTGALPSDGVNREVPDGHEPPLGHRPLDLPIRAPAQGARYPSRRAQPHGPGAGDRPRRSGVAVAGILAMGLVMLGIAAAMMARDLFLPAFARAAVAADEAPSHTTLPSRRS